MTLIQTADLLIAILFVVSYAYQTVYVPVALLKASPALKPDCASHRYAILIAARNEENVIGQLLDSIKAQHYPAGLVSFFVAADNCTDKTAQQARSKGAVVYERFSSQVGKGYALHFLLDQIDADYGLSCFDAFMVFDADNLLDENYICEMNKVFDSGAQIITSYRNTKNYADNWVSASHGLWFIREAQYLNRPRYKLHLSCAVSGTGYLFSYEVLKECGGWHFFRLTEDIEFTMHNIVSGRPVAFCERAVFYDEQPTSFAVSFKQRLRWSKGALQVFAKYGIPAFRKMLKGDFSCFDMLSNNLAAYFLAVAGVGVNVLTIVLDISSGNDVSDVMVGLLNGLILGYATMWLCGFITTVSEWRRIEASPGKKILYTFTFPLYMMSNLPIAIAALFVKVTWTPIRHSKAISLSQMRRHTSSLLNVSQINIPK